MKDLMISSLEVVDLAITTVEDFPISFFFLPIIELQSRTNKLETKYDYYYYPRINQKFEECRTYFKSFEDTKRTMDRID